MDKTEKIKFIERLIGSMQDDIRGEIETGKIPENWTGIELRQLIADRAEENTLVMSRYQKASYQHDKMINVL